MSVHRLRRVQRLDTTVEEAWAFFSDPRNLSRITPPWLGFEISSPPTERIYTGQIVVYRVRPLLGLALTWVTEITGVEAPHRFVDEQRIGPYGFWHHQHHLRPIPGGVEVEDLVHYALPLGPIGLVVDRLLVAPRLRQIFAYRRRVLAAEFGDLDGPVDRPVAPASAGTTGLVQA